MKYLRLYSSDNKYDQCVQLHLRYYERLYLHVLSTVISVPSIRRMQKKTGETFVGN